MRESDLLSHIASSTADLAGHGGVIIGPGDDCALVELAGPTLLTVDQLVEDRHYTPDTSRELIARKAVARSVSDIAAMGGTPRFGLATGCLRRGVGDEQALFDHMHRWARSWHCPLVGGDIAFHDGPTVLTVTIIGTPHAKRGTVLRSGAHVGDVVCVSGHLGGSLASGRHLTFEPRLAEARWLCDTLGDRLTSMMDISDGLGRDAGRIGVASKVQLEIDAAALPCHAGCGWRQALSDGEDYELLYTVSGSPPTVCPFTGTALTVIGRVVSGSPGCVVVLPTGKRVDASEEGWNHE